MDVYEDDLRRLNFVWIFTCFFLISLLKDIDVTHATLLLLIQLFLLNICLLPFDKKGEEEKVTCIMIMFHSVSFYFDEMKRDMLTFFILSWRCQKFSHCCHLDWSFDTHSVIFTNKDFSCFTENASVAYFLWSFLWLSCLLKGRQSYKSRGWL
jgi:hypothetical protein